jgi:glutamyl/glutaminyl-tRNA synthetase
VNFLSLLGWSPGDDRELMTRDELIAAFSLEGISGGNAVFNPEKLDWFNQQYIMRLPIDELARRVEPWLRDAGLWRDDLASRRDWLARVLELIRPRVKRLDQFPHELRPFLADTVEFDQAAVAKHLARPEIVAAFAALPAALESVEPFDTAPLERALRGLAESHAVKPAALIHATRVAVTGRSVSPGLFDVLELLGRDRVTSRLRAAQKLLTE